MQTVKVMNGEAQRETEWRNLFADATNSRIKVSNLGVVDAAIRQFLFQGTRVASVFLLARRGLDGDISIGMISAYVAYLGMFTTRGCGIVDRVLEYKLLDVPLRRLADIVFSKEEQCSGFGQTQPIGDIEFRSVSFAYSQDEPDILKDCSVRMKKNRLTAIAGSSGAGKSTLLQLIAGNENASKGELLIDGQLIQRWLPSDLRQQMGSVFQGDGLLKGSVAENIAIFQPSIDMDRVRDAATAACIADEIQKFPMRYETRIGDLGSALSRGQVQRILLARAFYRRPALLLLDEATSGLDYELEKKVITSLANIAATTIVVTHSDLMLQAADTVLWLHQGKLLRSRPELSV
jgi:ATP-binding cassette subfamily B protein RaxB